MAQPVSLYGNRKLDDKYTEILINYVRDHPILYKRDSSGVYVTERKRLWEAFALKHELKVEDCKVRWKSIRYRYFHTKRRPSAKTYIHAHLLTFLDELMPPYLGRQNGPSNSTETVQKKNPTNPILNATVVTADMLVQILQLRQKEEPTNIQEKQSIFLTQEDPLKERIPVIYPTSVAETSNVISLRLPKFNFMSDSVSHYEKSRISTASAPEDVIVIEDDGVPTNYNTIEDNQACNRSLPIDGHNTETFDEASKSDKGIIETQYKETENILKNNTEGLNANLDFSTESTEKFFDEMGEYVENRFPEEKQQELKCQIWNLLWTKM